jgi:hypothetical protein
VRVLESARAENCGTCRQPRIHWEAKPEHREAYTFTPKCISCAVQEEYLEARLLKKLYAILFPKPTWVLEFEAALEADRVARQQQYAEWDRQVRGALVFDVRRESE